LGDEDTGWKERKNLDKRGGTREGKKTEPHRLLLRTRNPKEGLLLGKGGRGRWRKKVVVRGEKGRGGGQNHSPILYLRRGGRERASASEWSFPGVDQMQRGFDKVKSGGCGHVTFKVLKNQGKKGPQRHEVIRKEKPRG